MIREQGTLCPLLLDSGEEQELYEDPNLARVLAVSADGQRLVFGLDVSEGDTARLMIMPTSDGTAEELFKLVESAVDSFAEWTADGHYVLFSV